MTYSLWRYVGGADSPHSRVDVGLLGWDAQGNLGAVEIPGAIWAIWGHLGHSPLPWRTGFLLFPLFSYFVLLAPLKMLRGDVEIPFILIPAFWSLKEKALVRFGQSCRGGNYCLQQLFHRSLATMSGVGCIAGFVLSVAVQPQQRIWVGIFRSPGCRMLADMDPMFRTLLDVSWWSSLHFQVRLDPGPLQTGHTRLQRAKSRDFWKAETIQGVWVVICFHFLPLSSVYSIGVWCLKRYPQITRPLCIWWGWAALHQEVCHETWGSEQGGDPGGRGSQDKNWKLLKVVRTCRSF